MSKGGDQSEYTIYQLYGDKNGTALDFIARLPFHTTTYTHYGLTPGDYWYYRLVTKNRRFKSPATNLELRLMTCPQIPSPPQLLESSHHHLQLGWSQPTLSGGGYDT